MKMRSMTSVISWRSVKGQRSSTQPISTAAILVSIFMRFICDEFASHFV